MHGIMVFYSKSVKSISETLTLMQGRSGLAEETSQRWNIWTIKQAIILSMLC